MIAPVVLAFPWRCHPDMFPSRGRSDFAVSVHINLHVIKTDDRLFSAKIYVSFSILFAYILDYYL
jgi:hypothetical protein